METGKTAPRPLAVLIGTCNRIEHLQRCIDSLREYSRDFLEIVVSDAGSTDGSQIYLKTQKDVRVILESEKRGQARALNEAASQIQSEFLCWISDDNVVQPRILVDAVRCLQCDLRLGMLGLKVKDRTGPYAKYPFIGGVSETGVLNCNQGIIRREVFESVGGFSEELRDYMIDTDLTTKVLLAGWDVALTKQVAIEHYRDHETDSWISSASRKERITKNRKIYFERYAGLSQYALDILLGTIVEKERFRQRAVVGMVLCAWNANTESVCHALRAYYLFLRTAFVDKREVNPPGSLYCLRQSLPKHYALPAQNSCAEDYHNLSTVVTQISKTLFRAHCAGFDVLSALYNQDRSWFIVLSKYIILRLFDARYHQADRLLHAIRAVTGLDEGEALQMTKDIHHQKKCRKLLDSYMLEYAGFPSATNKKISGAISEPDPALA